MNFSVSSLLFLVIFVFLYEKEATSEIYKIIRNDGVIHITDNPSRRGYIEDRIYLDRQSVRSESFSGIINDIAGRYEISPRLIEAIIEHESGFDPKALSPKGAMGLMQLMPETAKRFGVKDPFNPRDNIKGGVSYLDYLMKMFDGDLKLVLAAYNAGESAVKQAAGVPPFKETEEYILKVMRQYKKFGAVQTPGIHKLIKKDGTILLTNRSEKIESMSH